MGHKATGRTYPLGCALLVCEAHMASAGVIPMLKNPINRETPRNNPRFWTTPSQASIPLKYHLETRSGTLPEGEITTGGHLHHPGGLHDEEGVVYPRG